MASEMIERALYHGTFNMVHNPNARGRAPRYLVNGTEKPKGVTTILGGTLAKDFVSWALNCMEEVLQSKAPVITADDIAYAKLESTRRRDSGAGTGTEAHALVEQYLKGIKVAVEGASQEARNAFNAFVKWFEIVTPNVVNVEEVIYSPKLKFAGTYDCMLEIDGKVYLCDLKTTNASRKAPNGVYAENFLQLGAYAMAHEEQRHYEELDGGTELRKIDGLMVISAKKNGKLDIVTEDELGLTVAQCGELFTQVVNLYNFMADSTKALGGK